MGIITVFGYDIAKRVIHLRGMNRSGTVLLRKRLYRSEVLSFFAQVGRCTVALESCRGSSYWARESEALGLYGKTRPSLVPKAVCERPEERRDRR